MTTLLTLDIVLSGWRRPAPWSARIEVPDGFTLNDLHAVIQDLVDFDDDHLHEFAVGRTWRDRGVSFEVSSPIEPSEAEETPLSDVFPLQKGLGLFYHFDFGDDWIFKVTCRRGSKEADTDADTWTLVAETGERPAQYPDSEDDAGEEA